MQEEAHALEIKSYGGLCQRSSGACKNEVKTGNEDRRYLYEASTGDAELGEVQEEGWAAVGGTNQLTQDRRVVHHPVLHHTALYCSVV